MGSLDLDWLISVDDHVLEPPDVWQKRVPAKFREAAPKLVTGDDEEFWLFEGKKVHTGGLAAVVGKGKEFSPEAIRYADMAPGCYDPVARAKDMDLDGVLASVCFPSFPRFCGQLFWEAKDKELALEGVRAYNDWMIDEWCAAVPGRFIPLVIMPLWDPQLAVAELQRTAAKGARGVAFSENPAPLGLPTIHDRNRYWDPVWAAAQDLELVVCMHVGSSSQLSVISPESPVLANLSYGSVRTAGAMLEWIFSGVFQRFPGLKIALSEGNIGWIPFFLQRAEQVIATQREWASQGISFDPMPGTFSTPVISPDIDLDALNPWETFRNHIYGCFIDDGVGLANLGYIGEDNVMIETDYPHSDSTFPNSMKLAKEQMAAAKLSAETQYKVLRGNAERLFRFTPATPPTIA